MLGPMEPYEPTATFADRTRRSEPVDGLATRWLRGSPATGGSGRVLARPVAASTLLAVLGLTLLAVVWGGSVNAPYPF
jgi:hypothetical protein